MPEPASSPRQWLLKWFQAALASAHGGYLVERALAGWHPAAPVHLVAIGKAAPAMAAGAVHTLKGSVAQGLVIMPHGAMPETDRMPEDFVCLRADHPIPGNGSLHAGQTLLEFIRRAPNSTRWLFLISGGASSLVEVLPHRVALEDVQKVNRWLIASGWDIARTNAVRRQFSLIKGGQLAVMLDAQPVRALYVSDVPGNDPAMIGSGLLAPPLAQPDIRAAPAWLRKLAAGLPARRAGDAVKVTNIDMEILADNTTATSAAANAARDAGFSVTLHDERLTGDAADAGGALARELLDSGPGVHVRGGECTVKLPPDPGRGGRCQQLALAAALQLRGHGNCYLLAAGSDGRDGNSNAAGALVDGDTIQRGMDAGLDARDALRRADSNSFLEACGDLIDTGPTGTNVNDLIIGLKR